MKALVVAMLAMCAALLGGCGLFGGEPKAVRADWDQLTVVTESDANGNSAVAVDVVLVRDKALLDKLLAMPASAYFAARADLLRTFPDGLTVLPLELTPGQRIDLDHKRLTRDRAWAALVYANYATPGDHRQRLLLDSSGYRLVLGAQDLVARDIKTGAIP